MKITFSEKEELEFWGERELIEEIIKLRSALESIPFDDIETMVDYDYDDELEHYEEMVEECSEDNSHVTGHIYLAKKGAEDWLKKFKKQFCGGESMEDLAEQANCCGSEHNHS